MNWTIVVNAIMVYFILLMVLKFMGKREIGQLSLFDLVVILIIADLAVVGIEKSTVDFLYSLIPIFVIGLIQKIIAMLLLKFPKLRNLFDGKESLIIVNGKVNIKEMHRIGYNVDDLLTQLRLKNIRSISEVRFALLETNGEISVFRYDEFDYPAKVKLRSPSQTVSTVKEQLSLTPFPVIVSGEIRKDNLKILKLSRKWLIEELKKEGYDDYHNIYYASYDDGKLFIVDTCEV